MFTRKEQLLKKTGDTNTGRYEFLKSLIHEFATTKSYGAKKQTLANLSNFAYDPINYEFLKQLHVIDLFLAQLSENSEELIHFALAGLCNISCDPECRERIISLNGIVLVSQYLEHGNEEVALNALTTLFYLCESNEAVLSKDIEKKIRKFQFNSNSRFKNLGLLFIDAHLSNNNRTETC